MLKLSYNTKHTNIPAVVPPTYCNSKILLIKKYNLLLYILDNLTI